MARIVTTDNTLTAPAWAGDFMNREHLVPGGARLDPAQFTGDDAQVPSGTIIGRTLVERDAGDGFGPGAAADDELFIVAFDVTNAAINPDVELYRPGSVVKENFLPAAPFEGAGPLAILAALRERYICTIGAA